MPALPYESTRPGGGIRCHWKRSIKSDESFPEIGPLEKAGSNLGGNEFGGDVVLALRQGCSCR